MNNSLIPEMLCKDSHHKPFPISSLLKKLQCEKLDINASYQRDEVWNDNKKTNLIQSILGNINIPNLIINFCKKEDKLIVIDGKQRLSAMRDFKNNKVKFYNESSPDQSCLYKDLDSKYQDQFDDYTIHVTIYENLDEAEQRDIFQRINYGENLTIGEKIKGMKSKIIEDIMKLKKDFSKYLNKFDIKCKRESHLECIIALLALYLDDKDYISKGISSIKYINLLNLRKKVINISEFKDKIIEIFEKISEMHDSIQNYSIKKNYNKPSKIRWTDLLVYIKILLDSKDQKSDIKYLTTVKKFLLHKDNNNKYLLNDKKDSNGNEIEVSEYLDYLQNFTKRSNTNTNSFFTIRIEIINNLYKYITKTNPHKRLRDKVFIKSGEREKGICKLCNKHEIQHSNFEVAHIISKKNGGSYEINNLYPTCAFCNKSMGSMDMDIYAKERNIDLNLIMNI